MTKFHLLMNGQNFLVDVDGKTAKHGFYQNLFLEAESPEQAEKLAVARTREDEDLRAMARNPEDDPPVLVLEELNELETFNGVEAMVSGRAWYREKRWWQFWR